MSVADNLKLAAVSPQAAFEHFPLREGLMERRASTVSGFSSSSSTCVKR